MSTNLTAFVKRRTVATAAELKAGEHQLERGQWGYATTDDRVILRDLEGRFHELLVESEAVPLMDELILTNTPVPLFANLPAGDPPGSMRLVSSEIALYVRGLAGWIKQPMDSIYADFIGIGAIEVAMGTNIAGDVPIGTISHKTTDGFRHLPITTPVTDLNPIIINGRTYPVVAVGDTVWLGEDLGYDILNSGNANRPPTGISDADWASARLYSYDEMKALNDLLPDWRVADWGDWSATFSNTTPRPWENRFTNASFQGDNNLYGDDSQCHPSYKSAWEYKWDAGTGTHTPASAAFGTGPLKIKPNYGDGSVQYWTGAETKMRYPNSAYTNITGGYVGYPGAYDTIMKNGANPFYWYSRHVYPLMRITRKQYPMTTNWSPDNVYPNPYNPTYSPPGGWEEPLYRSPQELGYVRLVRKTPKTLYAKDKPLGATTNDPGSAKWTKLTLDGVDQGALSKKFSAAEYTDLTDGGNSTAHRHPTDGGAKVDVIYSQDFMYAHGWGRNPSVELIDAMGRHVWIEVNYPDENTIQILCNQPFTGTMRLT